MFPLQTDYHHSNINTTYKTFISNAFKAFLVTYV